jgi:hypothetical protein
MRFAKFAEQNYSTEIFRISEVIKRQPRPLYELLDLNDTSIVGQFYQEELSPGCISKQTVYKIDKILGRRTKHGIREVLVRWKEYQKRFNSWIPASSVKNIMNSANSFYVTLFSNGSQTLYPDNTVGAFTTELAIPIELDSEFRLQVSLCEFSCLLCWRIRERVEGILLV